MAEPVPLLGNPYQGKSIVANAQRAVNLYGESNEKSPGVPFPFTWYPTPGSQQFGIAANPGKARCTYRTSKGTAYTVIGPTIYALSSNGVLTFVGTIADIPSQVYMNDNGLVVVLVDGTGIGYAIDINDNSFAPIVDPSYLGADFVLYLDTFFVFNRPATNQFYISLSQVTFAMLTGTAIGTGTIVNGGAAYTNGVYSNVSLIGGTGINATAEITIAGGIITAIDIDNPGKNYTVGDILTVNSANVGGTGAGFQYTINTFALAFDPLDIAAKSGSADPIAAIITVHQELWLVGQLTTEIWIGTGSADFFFQQVQGAFIDHGCIAPYSATNQDVVTFWLSENKQGKCIVMQGVGYQVKEVSTPRIVSEFQNYGTVSDAIGFCFQIADHAYYALIFRTQNKSWLYDLTTGFWAEWVWLDAQGNFNAHRANCSMFAYGQVLVGDFANGKILTLSDTIYTDDGMPIIHLRSFSQIMMQGDRVTYQQFIATMQVGTANPDDNYDPPVLLSWADDGGEIFGFPVEQGLGKGGKFLTQLSWNRLGMARSRVFQIQWSAPVKTALSGAYIQMKKSGS